MRRLGLLFLWAAAQALTPLVWAQALSWETVRAGLQYARQDIPIEGTDSMHRLHWLRLDLTQPDLHLALTPQSCAGLQMPDLDRPPIVASMNASFFSKEFLTRGHTVSQAQVWKGNYRLADSPVLACSAGQRCQALHQAPALESPAWVDAAAGVQSLVQSGRARSDADDAQCGAFCTTTHPRSAIGLDTQGQTMVWVAAEGRQKFVTGLPLAKLARLMQTQSVFEAINFDGGGSTALHLEGQARTHRPDNEPQARAIANAWVLSTQPVLDWAAICQKPAKTSP